MIMCNFNKRGNMRTKLFAMLLVSVLLLDINGCAFGTRRPILEYSPITSIRPSNNIVLQVIQLEDNRSDKNIIGNVRNAWGMKTADVVTDTNISRWITSALKSELKNAGYTVVDENSENEIKGEVTRVYCDALLNYEGEVSIKIVLNRGGEGLLNKIYSGKASALNWAATAKSYGVILQRSLQQAMNQVITDVDRTIK